MDNIDHITDVEQRLFDLRLQAVTCKSLRPSAAFCTDCGNSIPAQRRETLPGVQLCVGCQEVVEAQTRIFGGRV